MLQNQNPTATTKKKPPPPSSAAATAAGAQALTALPRGRAKAAPGRQPRPARGQSRSPGGSLTVYPVKR